MTGSAVEAGEGCKGERREVSLGNGQERWALDPKHWPQAHAINTQRPQLELTVPYLLDEYTLEETGGRLS